MGRNRDLVKLWSGQAVAVAITLTLTGAMALLPERVACAQLTVPLQTHFDIIAGKNNPGPYNLSWTNIEAGKETPLEVILDGQTLKPELYRVDAVKGQITFATPLSDKSVARITYRYNPGVAKSNPGVASQPLYLPVTRFGHNTLKLIALPNGDLQKTGSVPLVWSLGGQTHFLGGGLTSQLNISGKEKTGVQMGFKRGNDKNLVDASFVRNNREFATSTGKAVGMGDAVQRKGLEARLTPAKYLATNYKMADDVNFVTNERKASEVYGFRFGQGGPRPTLNYSRNDTLTVTPDRKETKVLSNRFDFGAGLNKVTTFAFNRADDATTTPDGKETIVVKDRIDLKTKLDNATAVNLNRAKDLTVLPDKRDAEVQHDLLLLQRTLDKTASVGFNRAEDTTVTPDNLETRVRTDKVDLSKKLDKMTSVTATTLEAITNGSTDAVEALAKGAIFSLTSSLNGGAKQATATVNTASKQSKTAIENDKTMTVRLQPGPVFIVSASQSEQQVTPVSANGTAGAPTVVLTQTASAEIVPLPGTKMTSSVAETTNNDIKVSSTNFGWEVGTGKHVEIKANVTNRSSEAPGNSPLDTTHTQVALRPSSSITLTGAYTWNPVDQNGAIRQALCQEFGVTANVGAIQVGSAYTLTTVNGQAKAEDQDPQFGMVSVNLGLRFSKFTKFNGTYKDSLRYRAADALPAGQIPKYLRVYNLGITHDIGPAFNLTIGGSRTEDRSRAKLPTDITAEAKVGVRF